MGHRRFLPDDHVFRKNKKDFDGKTEYGTVRKGFDAFSRVENLNNPLGKRARDEKGVVWKKKSQFFGTCLTGGIYKLDTA